MHKKVLLLIVLLGFALDTFAQDVTTTFYDSDWLESTKFHERAALYQVRLSDYFTYVTIKVQPTKKKKRQLYWTSKQTYVLADNVKLPLLGAAGQDNTFHSCTYEDGWGWNNVSKGQNLYYTLIFSGRIPEGITNFSLVDEATNGKGYCFMYYTISNPKTHSLRDEGYCKRNAEQNNDGICGIYEEIGGNKYRIACVKEKGKYYLVFLGCSDNLPWWFQGDIKAFLEESATFGTFKANWIMQNKIVSNDAYVVFDGQIMKSFLPEGTPSESTFIKMYPTSSSSSYKDVALGKQIWTGTGFALTNNYIVTNYHVIEDARNIQVQGINGNFNTKFSATIVATDKHNDIAILKVNGCTISSKEIPYSVKTLISEVGEDVFVLGYPLTSTMGEEIKLTTGVISSKSGFQGDLSQYQISAPIQPGNSGGPLFDNKGDIIGIVSAKHLGVENVGYAIKTSYLRNLMESVISTNIFPLNNKLSSLSLSEKVKAVKKYIYYLTCSNSDNSSSSSISTKTGNNSDTNDITYNNPVITKNMSSTLKIISVVIQDNQTIVSFSANNKDLKDGGYFDWIRIENTAHIIANGKKYTLVGTDGIAISPEKSYYSYDGETKFFSLFFPAIPKNTTTIDFIESDDSDWKIFGIQLR